MAFGGRGASRPSGRGLPIGVLGSKRRRSRMIHGASHAVPGRNRLRSHCMRSGSWNLGFLRSLLTILRARLEPSLLHQLLTKLVFKKCNNIYILFIKPSKSNIHLYVCVYVVNVDDSGSRLWWKHTRSNLLYRAQNAAANIKIGPAAQVREYKRYKHVRSTRARHSFLPNGMSVCV